jgi:acyl-CoA synthetase (NDP forming)
MRDLTPLMEPRSVAVIGASATPPKPGYLLLKNIVDGGYPGAIYPINPRGGEILGHQAYPAIGDVPGPVDLAFVVLGRESIPDVLRACINKGVRAALIITAGFREVGGAGDGLQDQLEAIARDRFVVGTPDECVRQIQRFRDTFGVDHLICRLYFPGMPHEHIMQELRLIAKEIRPAFR